MMPMLLWTPSPTQDSAPRCSLHWPHNRCVGRQDGLTMHMHLVFQTLMGPPVFLSLYLLELVLQTPHSMSMSLQWVR